jgi:citrate/tricarballylate utilization protein
MAVLTSLCIAVVITLAAALRSTATMSALHRGPGAFYAVIPESAMLGVAMTTLAFSVLALGMSVRNFWRDTGNGPVVEVRAFLRAAVDVLTLRNLGGGGHGCNHRDEALSQSRRYAHHTMFYGFLLCFVSTCCAAFYEHVLGLLAPYPFFSVPVLTGTVGGFGMLLGTAWLIWIKVKSDRAPVAKALMGNDYALLTQLFLAAGTGLLLLILRDTRFMGMCLALHLGAILSFFVALPYSKFVHGIYRSAALVRNAAERPSK